MTVFEEQLEKQIRHVRLSEDERALMRSNLVRYMEHVPRRTKHAPAAAQRTPYFGFLSLFRAHHLSGALMIALVTSGFGMTYAAADALPGDMLYTVKVDINEAVIGALLTGGERQLAWERERAERRLLEASRLALEGRLDQGRREEVARRFAQHTDNMVKQVIALGRVDPVLAAEVSNEFEVALDTHEAVLARLSVEKDEAGTNNAIELVSQVRTVAMRVNELAADAESQIQEALAVAEDVEVSVAATSEATGSAETVVDRESPNLRVRATYRMQDRAIEHKRTAEVQLAKLDPESEVYQQAKGKIEFANVSIDLGAAHLAKHDVGAAYNEFRTAALALQKVGLLLEATNTFNFSILDSMDEAQEDRTAGASATTSERQKDALIARRDQVNALLTETRSALLVREGLSEQENARVNAYVKDAMALVLRAEIAIVLEQQAKAEGLLMNAERLVQNAHTVLGQPARPLQTTPVKEAQKPSEPKLPQAPSFPDITPPRLDVVTVYHTKQGNVHTLSGVYYTPTPCFTLGATATAGPDAGTIRLDLTAVDAGGVCAMVIDRKAYTVTVEAAADAQIEAVTVNRSQSEFEVIEGENTAIFDDPQVIPVQNTPLPPPSTSTQSNTSSGSLVERTIRTTTGLLR